MYFIERRFFMKKFVLITLLVISCMLISGMAYAQTTLGGTGGTSTTFGGGVYKPSTNVTVNISASTTMYTATSAHSGAIANAAGKAFYTLGSSPQIWSCTDPSGYIDAGTAGSAPTSLCNPATWQ
jgi:hypothetical protein